ncbi:MAG: SUMF1/EgtB/PvdO family nonheme iron enzyme [Planctomycetes bacterium]|nr:SUMF1/EgtB/PvdO family nonheme iron enzyme [Planctomycetota bacterium]
MGTVWRAHDRELQRVVALKQLKSGPHGPPDEEQKARFLREARLAARLRHPGIVSIHDVGFENGIRFLTMDFIEGRTLGAYLAETAAARRATEPDALLRRSALPGDEAEARRAGMTALERLAEEVALLADAASAVGHAHAEGIIHRDLKPSNLLLDAEGRVYVTDFGLAREADPPRARPGAEVTEPAPAAAAAAPPAAAPPLTNTGRALGTDHYMSPEQWAGGTEPLGPPADVWALGVMLYEILTGRLPFEGEGAAQVMAAAVLKPPIPPSRRNPALPADLEAVCLRALSKDPAARHPTAAEFALALETWLGAEARTARRWKSADVRARVEDFRKRHRTALLAMVFSDVVGSTALKQRLGDQAAVRLLWRHEEVVRGVLQSMPDSVEVKTAGDSFFCCFVRPSDAIRFAVGVQSALRREFAGTEPGLVVRIGVHLGEVLVQEAVEGASETPPRPSPLPGPGTGGLTGVSPDAGRPGRRLDLYGLQVDTAARVQSLALGGQVLCTRPVFDNARQVLPSQQLDGVEREVRWLSHGLWRLKGVEDPLEICEVGEAGAAPLRAPNGSEKAKPVEAAGPDEEEPGWRPAPGLAVPNTEWILDAPAGRGGFGEVWKAVHRSTKEACVFKFCFVKEKVRSLRKELALFRLLREKAPEHPNIVRLREVYLEAPPYRLAMEHVEGRPLSQWLLAEDRLRVLSLEAKCEIAAQVADALDVAAAAGVIHQDVKPANTLVDEAAPPDPATGAPRVKLSDFGVGRVVSEEVVAKLGLPGGGRSYALSTAAGSDSGTLMYLAPERIEGRRASTRSDLYSLGVVLFQMAVGDLKRSITADASRAVADPLLQEDLGALLAHSPESRPARGAEVAKQLRGRAGRRLRRSVRRAEVALAAAGVLVLAILSLLRMGSALGTPRYALTLHSDPADGGEVHPAITRCAAGEDLTLEARPRANWLFKEWSDGDSTNPRAWRMPAMDSTLTARFVRDLEPLGKNEQGLEEFRHGTTGMVLILLPAGRFRMGLDRGGEDEKPVHDVTLSRPFLLGKFEVTQEQWRGITGEDPSFTRGDRKPVESVTWNQCDDFLKKLNRGVAKDGFRLPTEAEWEYACRAGATTKYCFGDEVDRLGEYAWYGHNSGSMTHPVGEKKPNAWGLYDMHGNVWEWCFDWYDGDFYKTREACTDPSGPTEPRASRVVRGGSWDDVDWSARAAYRGRVVPGRRSFDAGVRVARSR